jgi:hypothetical protein
MNCIITVPGDGIGRNGKSKKDRVGPVRKFIVGNEYLYRQIYNHVKTCSLCDPTAILQAYLTRRVAVNDHQTTGSLVRLAQKYYKLDRGVPASLVREFEIRAGITKEVSREDFSLHELAKAVKIGCSPKYLRDGTVPFIIYNINARNDSCDAELVAALVPIVKDRTIEEVMALGPDDQGMISNLISVAGVMLS